MSEFDQFSQDYKEILNQDLKMSGESSDYFAKLKVKILKQFLNDFLPLENAPELRIAEVGCGVGGVVKYLPLLERPLKSFAMDVSFDSVKMASIEHIPCSLLNADASRLPFANETVDVVCFAGVLHHLTDPTVRRMVFDETHRVLKKGGILAVFEHNPLNPLTRWVVRHSMLDKGAKLVNMKRLVREVVESGLSVRKKQYTTFFPKYFSVLRFLEPKMGWCALGAQYFLGAAKNS